MFHYLRLVLLSLVAAYTFAQLHAVTMNKIGPVVGKNFGSQLFAGLMIAFQLFVVHLFFSYADVRKPHAGRVLSKKSPAVQKKND